jgi:signal peptide peptidase SppA
MHNITHIILENGTSLSCGTSLPYDTSLFAIKFIIALAFISIIPCLISCSKMSNKLQPEFNNKRFDIVKYSDIYSKDVANIKSICLDKTYAMPKKRKICCRRKTRSIDETQISLETKKKYMYYSFNNLDKSEKLGAYIDMPNRQKNDPFNDLESFVNVVLKTCNPYEFEILLHISSPGGIAYQFECAYTNLLRLKKKGFNVTILIDDICASGGYMLACAGNKIVASPYSKIGSIGVIASYPNYYGLATKIGIDNLTFKTGKYKGGFPCGTQYTDENIENENELIGEIFNDFKNIVLSARPDVDIEKVFTGRVWPGIKAKELNLIDDLSTSHDYLDELSIANEIYLVVNKPDKKNTGLIDIFFESLSCKIAATFQQFYKSSQFANINTKTMLENIIAEV